MILATVEVSRQVLTLLPHALLGLALYLACTKVLRLLGQDDKAFLSHLLPERLQWVTRLL